MKQHPSRGSSIPASKRHCHKIFMSSLSYAIKHLLMALIDMPRMDSKFFEYVRVFRISNRLPTSPCILQLPDNSPHRNSPHDNSPHRNSPHDCSPLWQLAPWTARAMYSSLHGQFTPWTARLMDSSPHGQLAPWTTRPMDNSPHGGLLGFSDDSLWSASRFGQRSLHCQKCV
jgi:hypothetical protein